MSLYIPENYCNILGSVENTERAIKSVKDMGDSRAEVVHSLAKWKRIKLAHLNMQPGRGT